MKAFLFFFITILLCVEVHAQVGVIQDAKGEGSLTIKDNVVAINSQNESISFGGALRFRADTICDERKRWIGFTAKANGKDATAALFKGTDFKFDGEFGLYYFITKIDNECSLTQASSILQKYVSVNFAISQFMLFDSTKVFAEQLKDESKVGPKITLGINFYPATNISWVLGGAINFGTGDNLKDLSPLTVTTTTGYTSPAGQGRTVSRDSKTAYKYSSYVSSQGYLNVNADVGFIAFGRFPFLFHGRYSATTKRKPQFNPGIGIYINKEGAPTEIIGGLQYQVLDLFNTAASGKSAGGRGVFNLVAGFVIN